MKAYLVLFVLLASILFFPTSLLARELAAGGNTGGTTDPKKPVPCKSEKGKPYNCHNGKRPPKCNKKYSRGCAPNSSP